MGKLCGPRSDCSYTLIMEKGCRRQKYTNFVVITVLSVNINTCFYDIGILDNVIKAFLRLPLKEMRIHT